MGAYELVVDEEAGHHAGWAPALVVDAGIEVRSDPSVADEEGVYGEVPQTSSLGFAVCVAAEDAAHEASVLGSPVGREEVADVFVGFGAKIRVVDG